MVNKRNQGEKISKEMSVYLRVLHQEGNVSCMEIKRRFPQYALRSIYRHCKKRPLTQQPTDLRKKKQREAKENDGSR